MPALRSIVFALIVAAVLAGSCGRSAPTIVEASAHRLLWHRVSIAGGPGDQAMLAVAAAGTGLIAVGHDATGRDAAVWASDDGASWQRVVDPTLGGDGDQVMTGVATGTFGVAAVGHEEDPSGRRAAAWWSADGGGWQRATVPDPDSESAMLAISPWERGLVAVGTDGGGAAVWISADGRSWEQVHLPEAAGEQAMLAVAATSGALVAVGYDARDGDRDGAAWTSPDGTTWTRVSHDEEVFGGPDWQVMTSVTSTENGWVAVGFDDSEAYADAAVWRSAGPGAWQRVPHRDRVFGGGGDQEMHGIAVGGPGLVAVGVDWQADGDAASWASVRGTTWVWLSGERRPDDQKMTAVVALASRLVAVGYTYEDGDQEPAVWLGA